MGVNIKINAHHRNPSGFHNKVRWFISTSSRSLRKLELIYDSIDKEQMTMYEKFSWETAYNVAYFIILKTATGILNYRQEHDFIKSLDIDYIYKNCKIICENNNKSLFSDIVYTVDIIKKEIRSAFGMYYSPKEIK